MLAVSKGPRIDSQQSVLATCMRGKFDQWKIASKNFGRSSLVGQ